MSTFQAPLRVFGSNKEGAESDVGNVTVMQEGTVTFAEANVATALFYLPPNAVPIEFYLDTDVVFDAAATVVVETSDSSIVFVNGVTVTTVGRVLGSAVGAEVPDYSDIGTSAQQIQATVTATAPTTGSLRVRCLYWVNKVLPA